MKKRKVLKRKRLNRALESIFDYPLTIVEAPIGYGKTTAVKEFLLAKGSRGHHMAAIRLTVDNRRCTI